MDIGTKTGILSATACMMVLVPVGAAVADTQIEIQSRESGVQQIWVRGIDARFNTPGSQDYVLFLGKKNKMYAIRPAQKEIIDISSSAQSHQQGTMPKLNVSIKYEGTGPNVSGYSTKTYTVLVNGQKCETSNVSLKALKDSHLFPIMDALSKPSAMENMMKFSGNVCTQAQDKIMHKYKNLGLPLKTTYGYSRETTTISSINNQVRLPKGSFRLPAGYKMTSMAEKMKQAMPQGMPNMPPEVKKMLEKMRQQGQ